MTDPLASYRTTLTIREAGPALSHPFRRRGAELHGSFGRLGEGRYQRRRRAWSRGCVASTHCGLGDATARGVALDVFSAEVMGKASGIRRGRGGPVHVADLARGMLGADGIVGAGAPTALACGRLERFVAAWPAAAIADAVDCSVLLAPPARPPAA